MLTPKKIKVVPDTNVLIAAALNKSYCYDWLFGGSEPLATYALYTSEEILSELSRKLSGRFNFQRDEIVRYLSALDGICAKVRPSKEINAVRDPNDNIILECAVEARADLVITFDKDLLALKRYENIQIAHPSMTKYWFPKG
jgi:putative PIN family toxin of toxin-antitoxin system